MAGIYDGTVKFQKQVNDSFKSIFGIDSKSYHLLNKEGKRVFAKHDSRFLETKNLFILVKGIGPAPRNQKYSLGVYNPNYAIFVIGTEGHFYIFSTNTLKEYFKKNSDSIRVVKGYKYKNGITQYGALLSLKKAEQLCISKLIIDKNGATSAQAKLF